MVVDEDDIGVRGVVKCLIVDFDVIWEGYE